VEQGGIKNAIKMNASGSLHGLSNLSQFGMQFIMHITLEGMSKRVIVVEELFTKSTLFVRGEDLQTGRKTLWIKVPVGNMLNDYLNIISGASTSMAEIGNQISLEDVIALLQLGKYINSERVDNSGDELEFRTVLDIEHFLDSPDDLATVVSSLAAIQGVHALNNAWNTVAFYSGTFPGLAEDQAPKALLLFTEQIPAYVANTGIYDLFQRTPILDPFWQPDPVWNPERIQQAANGLTRIRWKDKDGRLGWSYMPSNGGSQVDNHIQIDISHLDKYVENQVEFGL
jgi:hypothetical protein